jgi:hypothetical protein
MRRMALVLNISKINSTIREVLIMEKKKEMVLLSTAMEVYMKDNGLMVKRKATENNITLNKSATTKGVGATVKRKVMDITNILKMYTKEHLKTT